MKANGHQHGLELVVGQHHAHRHGCLTRGAAFGLEQLGVAGIRLASQGQRLLVQGGRHDAGHVALLGQAHRFTDAGGGGLAGAHVHLPHRGVQQISRQAWRHPDAQLPRLQPGLLRQAAQYDHLGSICLRQPVGRTPHHRRGADHDSRANT